MATIQDYVTRLGNAENKHWLYTNANSGVTVKLFSSPRYDWENKPYRHPTGYTKEAGYDLVYAWNVLAIARGYGKLKGTTFINATLHRQWHCNGAMSMQHLLEKVLPPNEQIIVVPFQLLHMINTGTERGWGLVPSDLLKFKVLAGSAQNTDVFHLLTVDFTDEDNVHRKRYVLKRNNDMLRISYSEEELLALPYNSIATTESVSMGNVRLSDMFKHRYDSNGILTGNYSWLWREEKEAKDFYEMLNANPNACSTKLLGAYTLHKPAGVGVEYTRTTIVELGENGESPITKDSKEYWLISTDEGQAFASRLPKFKSVLDAYTVIKPKVVREYPNPDDVIRQGEWYFMPICKVKDFFNHGLPKTEAQLKREVKMFIEKALPKSHEHSNSHVCRQFTIGNDIFAIGKVRHPQHRTTELEDTVHLVARNTSYQDYSMSGRNVD